MKTSTTRQDDGGLSYIISKIFPHHAQLLLKNGVLFYDDDWNFVPHEQVLFANNHHLSKNSTEDRLPPRYFITNLSPNNYNFKLFCQSTLLPSSDDNIKESSWFDQILKQIEQYKEEPLEEYYQYLSEYEIRAFLKMNDRNVYERWAQYANSFQVNPDATMNEHKTNHCHNNDDDQNLDCPSFFALHLQVYNGSTDKYEPASLIGMCIKSVLLRGKQENIGFDGSGWLHKKYRGNTMMKGSLWYLHLLIHRQMRVRYSYGHVFEGNVKSFKSIIKSGMIPTKLRLSYIGMKLDELIRRGKDLSKFSQNTTKTNPKHEQSSLKRNDLTFHKIETYREYEDLMKSVYHNDGLILKNLKSYFENQYFLGCYYNRYLTFQMWKGQYSKDMKTGLTMPVFLVFNVKNISTCDTLTFSQLEHFDNMMFQLSVIISQLGVLSNIEHDNSPSFVLFATAGGPFLEYLLTHYSKESSISCAHLRIVLQDVDLFFEHIEQKGSTQSSSNQHDIQEFFTKPTPSDDSSLFIDIRDCASKPLVWLPSWSEHPNELLLSVIDGLSRLSCM